LFRDPVAAGGRRPGAARQRRSPRRV